jgi:hypothetical protein
MRPETESLEGLGEQSRKGHAVLCPRGLFVFYCLAIKIGTLGERPLLAQSSRSSALIGEEVLPGLWCVLTNASCA